MDFEKKRLKICLLTHTLPRFSGDSSAPFIGELAEALSKRAEVFVLAPDDVAFRKNNKRNYKLLRYKYVFPLKYQTLGYSRTLRGDKTMDWLSYLLSPFLYFFATLALIRLIKREKIDIITAHWLLPNGFIALLAFLVTGVPYTVTIPGSDVYMASRNILFKWMAGLAVKQAVWVISDSRYYLQELNQLGFYPDKSDIIRYGVDRTKFKRGKKNLKLLRRRNIFPDDVVILAVGRLVAKKGFIYLVGAMPEILRLCPKVKLLLVGDGEEREKLKSLAKKLAVANKISFAGTVSFDELHEYYNLGNIFVMPSIKDEKGNVDASPVAMMEAMMCGLSVVGTKYAAGDIAFPEPLMGVVVKEKNSLAIADAICRLIREVGVGKDQVRRLAIRYFSLTKTANSYMEIFENVLKC